MEKKTAKGSFKEKLCFILKKIGRFFVFLKDAIVRFFKFLGEKLNTFLNKKEFRFGIKYKILLGFAIPLIFIVIVGLTSFSKAKDGMRNRYEKSTLETVRMVGSQIDMITFFMKNEVAKYVASTDLGNLLKGAYESNVYEESRQMQSIRKNLVASQGVNPYVANFYIITPSKYNNISTKNSISAGFFEELYDSLNKNANGGDIERWIDSHSMIDSKMELNFSGSDAYLFSYQTLNQAKNALIAIDVSKEKVQDLIDGIDLGDGTVLGIITMNGKELLQREPEAALKEGESVFSGKSYYEEILGKEELYGIKEVEYNGDDSIMVYSICEDTGIAVAAMVPISIVTSEASSIRLLTLILVSVALVVVISIAFVISANIQKNVKSVSNGLGEVSKGNLKVEVSVTGHDEFRDLASATVGMISNTKKLVSKVDMAAESLSDSAHDVQSASETLNSRSEEILKAVSEMSEGMEKQKKYAEDCTDTTDRLSDEIGNVSVQIGKIKEIVDETNGMIMESMQLVKVLGDKANDTTNATDSVKNSVKALADETNKINAFVDVIKSISSQTHLLSLNASIEAARAGEAGRGFSVVAEEIRNLANQSAKSAGEITKLVKGINDQTGLSSESVDEARTIAEEQFTLINQSVEVFDRMKASMNGLIEELKNIDKATGAADARRNEAVKAVNDISDIINDSARSAASVTDILSQLRGNISDLDRTASKLGESMEELKAEVRAFKI